MQPTGRGRVCHSESSLSNSSYESFPTTHKLLSLFCILDRTSYYVSRKLLISDVIVSDVQNISKAKKKKCTLSFPLMDKCFSRLSG